MAIEPLGSVMSAQAQTAQPVQAAKTVQKAAESPAPVEQQNSAVDNTTITVKDPETKDGQGDASQEQQQPNHEQLKQAVDQMNKRMAHSEAVFGIHEATNRVTIKIIDKDTKEVIKELPPEKTLDMIAKVWEMAGILIDEKR